MQVTARPASHTTVLLVWVAVGVVLACVVVAATVPLVECNNLSHQLIAHDTQALPKSKTDLCATCKCPMGTMRRVTLFKSWMHSYDRWQLERHAWE